MAKLETSLTGEESRADVNTNTTGGMKRKDPPSDNKSFFSGNNVVSLLDEDSEDETDGNGSNEVHKKPEAPKKGKGSDIIHLDD